MTSQSQGSGRDLYQQAMFRTSIPCFSKGECATPRSARRGASLERSTLDSAPFGLDGQAKPCRGRSVSRPPPSGETPAPFARDQVEAAMATPVAGLDCWTPRKTGNGKPNQDRRGFVSTHFRGTSMAPPKLGLALDTDVGAASEAPSVPQSPASQQQLPGGAPLSPRSMAQSSYGGRSSAGQMPTSARHRKIMESKSHGLYRDLPEYGLGKGHLETTGPKVVHPLGTTVLRQHAPIAEVEETNQVSSTPAQDLTRTLFAAQEPPSLSTADAAQGKQRVPALTLPLPGADVPVAPMGTTQMKPAPAAGARRGTPNEGSSVCSGGAGELAGAASRKSEDPSSSRQPAGLPAGLARLLHVAQQDAADRKERRTATGTPPSEILPCTAHVAEYVVPERRRDALCPTYTPRGNLKHKMEQRTATMHPQFTPRQLPKTQQQALKSFTPVARVVRQAK